METPEKPDEMRLSCELLRAELSKSLEYHRKATEARNWQQSENHKEIVVQLSSSLVKLTQQTIEKPAEGHGKE